MMIILKKELRLNIKTFLVWSMVVGGLGMACILLYSSMQDTMKDMADAFSNMGAFSDAFGMSTLSIATIEGYFATEVGVLHSLGGGMFAAILSIAILSKEEEGHTGEFLYSLPVSRNMVVAAKSLGVVILLVMFTALCGCLYALGFAFLGEAIPVREFLIFMAGQLLLDLEIAGICLAISAISGKNRIGLGLGITLLLYMYDIIGRVVPSLKEYLFLGPYSYANASVIFSDGDISVGAYVMAACVLVAAVAFTFTYYDKRDLAS